jgi:hypothetical protein
MENFNKKLIQVIDSQPNNQNGNSSSSVDEEEDWTPSDNFLAQAKLRAQDVIVEENSLKIDGQSVNVNKDLLRLEKDYFNGVQFQGENQTVINKMLNQNPQQMKKPDIQKLPESDSKNCISLLIKVLSKVKNFLPGFIKDTKDLMIDEDRKTKMNIDQIDEPKTKDEKVIEMVI